MKIIKLQSLIKESLSEAHQQGHWWIDNGGDLQQSGGEKEMKTEKWKHMKASADKIEITTWELTAQDLGIILQGIKKIMGAEETEKDPDADVGKDGYTGPRVDIILKKKDKSFKNVPLGILKTCLPSHMKNYEKGKDSDLAGPVTEEFHHLHKDYRLYEGDDRITAIFEDNSKLVFEVHFHNNSHLDTRHCAWRSRAYNSDFRDERFWKRA